MDKVVVLNVIIQMLVVVFLIGPIVLGFLGLDGYRVDANCNWYMATLL